MDPYQRGISVAIFLSASRVVAMLSMEDVVNYCGDVRCSSFFEGCAILQKGLLIQCRVKKKEDDIVDIFAKCLQNLSRNRPPHKISVKLREKTAAKEAPLEKSYKIENAECSCETGSKKCHHISAVLIKLERTGEDELEHPKSPELLPLGKHPLTEKGKKLYNPMPVKEFACPWKEGPPDELVNAAELVEFTRNLRELTAHEVEEAYDFLMSGIGESVSE